jgi:hypothetical protein
MANLSNFSSFYRKFKACDYKTGQFDREIPITCRYYALILPTLRFYWQITRPPSIAFSESVNSKPESRFLRDRTRQLSSVAFRSLFRLPRQPCSKGHPTEIRALDTWDAAHTPGPNREPVLPRTASCFLRLLHPVLVRRPGCFADWLHGSRPASEWRY